jgi:hypothetical protein
MPEYRFTSLPAANDFCGPHRIPSRENARKKAYCPERIYRCRHKIESFFRRIKGLASRCNPTQQARTQLSRRNPPRRSALFDQIVRPDPSHQAEFGKDRTSLRLVPGKGSLTPMGKRECDGTYVLFHIKMAPV